MTRVKARPRAIHTEHSIAASLIEMTCAVRWKWRRSVSSRTTITARSAAHAHDGAEKLAKRCPSLVAAIAQTVGMVNALMPRLPWGPRRRREPACAARAGSECGPGQGGEATIRLVRGRWLDTDRIEPAARAHRRRARRRVDRRRDPPSAPKR